MRSKIILRDSGCDLGILDREIIGERVLVHHMNPLMLKDLVTRSDLVLNPEYLITISASTHRAVHYGDKSLVFLDLSERMPNDTTLWRKNSK